MRRGGARRRACASSTGSWPSPTHAAAHDQVHSTDREPRSNERRRKSERGRLENIRRLRVLRQPMLDDLLATLAWVRELVTMIHLAKFSGAPASRAEELVSQIAAAVEGLKEASDWRSSRASDECVTTDESGPTRRTWRASGQPVAAGHRKPACFGIGSPAGRSARSAIGRIA